MLKFTLTTNTREGFKLSTHAESKEEIEILEKMTLALIEKIEKIKVEIGGENY